MCSLQIQRLVALLGMQTVRDLVANRDPELSFNELSICNGVIQAYVMNISKVSQDFFSDARH